MDIYQQLGVKPIINAAGNMTLLGGSRPAPKILEAMEQANRHFVDMEELVKRSGAIIADLLGAEAALVTSGCAAAIALGTAACMSGNDPQKIERLPNATGMKDEILIQKRQRYKYDRCLTIFGGKLIEVGDERGTSAAQLEEKITERTAAVHYFAPGGDGALPVEEVIRISKRRGVPVMVDAAAWVYPVERLREHTSKGADLVCFGAKYFGALNSTGILCGRKDLMEAAFLHSFVGFETSALRSLGRPLKVDRQEVVAVVVALREWLSMDHRARLVEHERRGRAIREAIGDLLHVQIEWAPDERSLSSGLRVTIDEQGLGITATQVIEALRAGTPGIWVRGSGNWFNVAVTLLNDGDEQVIAKRLREVLKSRS